MEMDNRKIHILNLTGELELELAEYFKKRDVVVIDPLSSFAVQKQWTHIIVKDIADYGLIASTYQTLEKDIKLISLSAVDNIQSFIKSNGKMIFCEVWMKGPLGEFILDKYFQEYGGISLSESYPTFKELGSFNIVNPFNTGEYLDQMVHSAFLEGIGALSVKTFFDHLLMYLMALKKKEKIGLPIEVHYGQFQDVFGLQIHFLSKNLTLDDVTYSLATKIDRKSDNFLLNLAVQSTDFFDFSYLKEVNKVLVTALWTKDDRIRNENRGLLISNVSVGAKILNYPSEGVTSSQVVSGDLTDITENIVISGHDYDEDEFAQRISGQPKEIDDIVSIVKGKIDEQKSIINLGGDKFDVDHFVQRISTGIEDKVTDENMRVKVLDKLPDAIKNSFHQFSTNLGKRPDQLSLLDLDDFKNNEVPKLFRQTILNEKNSNLQIRSLAGNGVAQKNSPNDVNDLNKRLTTLAAENDQLKNNNKTLLTEIKILKESKAMLAEMNSKAKEVARQVLVNQRPSQLDDDFALKEHYLNQLKYQTNLNEGDVKSFSSILEKEKKVITEARENELQLRKLQIELIQKEAVFEQEIERVQRLLKNKDLLVSKIKESMTKLLERKEEELKVAIKKNEHLSRELANNPAMSQASQIQDLQRKILNYEKMINIYKEQIKANASRVSDNSTKDENKRLASLSTQLKSQLERAQSDLIKFKNRVSEDSKLISTLRTDYERLQQQTNINPSPSLPTTSKAMDYNSPKEIQELSEQVAYLEKELSTSEQKNRNLEQKLADALKSPKKDNSSELESRGKTGQLENSVRKLTQDLIESKQQMVEMKKDVNKLRQEKTALQNQVDRLKRDNEKSKGAGSKKPGATGKAS
jgi:hypothetical protein